MAAKYIIRLDDASEYMDFDKWDPYFKLFDIYNIKPIIAVIPFNKDPKLINNNPNIQFWEIVRTWQNKGYAIALHGYNHLYTTKDAGILGINPYSEFAGLDLEIQKQKIKLAYKIFERENIYPQIFVAPAHTFDKNTLLALSEITPIKIISDGFYLNPSTIHNFNWLPQQLSRPKTKNKGIWTICYHPETSNTDSIIKLEKFLKKHSDDFSDPLNISYGNGISIYDYLFSLSIKAKIKLLQIVNILR